MNRYSLIVFCMFNWAVYAQAATQAELEQCLGITGSTERLACFEALAVRGQPLSPSEPPEPEPESEIATEESAQSQPASREQADFGSEQLPREAVKDEEKETFHATVTKVTKGNYGALDFFMENGHIWRQIEPRFVAYPRGRPFPVTITRGLLGEYRLRVDGTGRLVPIRRIK